MNGEASARLPAEGPVRAEAIEDGAIWRVRLCTPKANLIDMEKIGILTRLFEAARSDPGLKAILIQGEGPHFSFGASVEEHLPGRFETMIPAFSALFRRILECEVVTLAAVRGQCLGGAMELAAFCHRVFASHEAKLGQPEIVLGVFPPIACVTLPGRVGRSRAEDLCLSGRILPAIEAHRIGLVDVVCGEPVEEALAYAREWMLPRSAASLRLTVRALRRGFADRFAEELAEAERSYMTELMRTRDATEGLTAFLEKRPPRWSNG